MLFLPCLTRANEFATDRHTVEISVEGAITQGALLDAAEGRARQIIVNAFAQQPEVNQVEVVVLGDRHGEIAPILTTTVTRNQWQSRPEVSHWSRYFTEGTHALLQRHDEAEPEIAAAPPFLIQNVPVPVNSPGPVPLIRRPAAPANTPVREPLQPAFESQVTQDNLTEWD
ncbi:MAG: hypothetical protein ACFB0C_24745 [Leptolyngbyaceae cyanobacterium]